MDQFGRPHWENDNVHNFTHDLSMFDHLGPPTTTILKVEPSAHVK
jgi:hypothetical protein